MRQLLLTLAAAAALVACERVDSTNVATQEIEAYVTVVSDGHGAEITARLELDGRSLTYVELGAGDALSANIDGHVTRLTPEPALSDYLEYGGALPVDWGPVEVRLHRPSWPSAVLTAVLPEPFELYGLPGEYWLVEDIVPIRWSHPTYGEARLLVTGRCIADYEQVVADDGQTDLVPGDLWPSSSWDGDTCPLTVTLERVDIGRVDPRLARGSIQTVQLRATELHVWH